MMRTIVVVSILFALALASVALAFDEPESFRGVPWGASEQQLRTTLGLTVGEHSCHEISPEQRWLGDSMCFSLFTLAETNVHAMYEFRADHFVGVLLTFDSSNFERIAAVFIERYGAPTSEARPLFQTQGGLTATNQVMNWEGPAIQITLERYGNKITEGLGSLWTQDEVRESMSIYREQTKGAANDL